MAEDLNLLRTTIQRNRATKDSPLTTPAREVYTNSKGALLVEGEVIDGTAENLSVVDRETFA